MRFRINPAATIYNLADLEELTLLDHLTLEQETAALGRRLDLASIKAMNDDLKACKTDKERAKHPDAIWLFAVSVWAARRKAGDTLTFADAIDFPMRDLEYLPEPQDHKAKADPTRARPGSGRAAKTVRKRAASSKPKASKRASTAG